MKKTSDNELFFNRTHGETTMELLWQLSAFLLIIYGGFLCYLLLRLFLSRAGSRAALPEGVPALPGVSVVIPFRNEAHNLEQLLISLDSQEFKGELEIILVNDCSKDNYTLAISSHQCRIPVKTIQSVFSDDRGLTSKQQALDAGIKAAAHEWVALTDADMRLESRWIDSLVKPTLAGADLVFGHTVIRSGKSAPFFTWFQKFQLETLFATAYTFDRADLAGSCMGNNLLISRKAYLGIGGFDAMGYSIAEDLHLLKTFRRNKIRTTAAEPFHATAVTFPAATISEYFQQLLRWSRGGFRKNRILLCAGTILCLQNLYLILALTGLLPDHIVLLTSGNLFLTWFFIAAAFSRIHSKENALFFPPFYVLILVESLALILLSVIKKPIVWKNRRVA